jgi:uroporphyrinogen decarboxylase
MNARERMLAAINREPVDRVPTDFWGTAEVRQRLLERFGTWEDVRGALHIDGMAGLEVAYVGPPPPEPPPGETVDPVWRFRRRNVDYGTGVYAEQSDYPLATAETVDDLERFAWPVAAWFDCAHMRTAAEQARARQAVQCGYMAPFYYHNQLRGLEESLMDPLIRPEFTHHLLQRITDSFYAQHRKMFESCEGLIDVTQVTDDYGSQAGPLIGLEVFREFYRPHLRRLIDLAHEFGIKVMHHDDGAMRDFLPDLVDMGIEILNPVQWTCPGMDLAALKRDFGSALCFHGGVENQRILPFGTPEEVRAEVRHCVDALASDGTGYILASCHNLQPVTPLENILALYDEAHRHGRRP